MTQKISNSLFHSFLKINEIHFHLSQLPFRLLSVPVSGYNREETEKWKKILLRKKLNKLDQKSNHKHFNKKTHISFTKIEVYISNMTIDSIHL
jgi:hypothetical protein